MPCSDILRNVSEDQRKVTHLRGEVKAIKELIARLQSAKPVDRAQIGKLTMQRDKLDQQIRDLGEEIDGLRQDYHDCVSHIRD